MILSDLKTRITTAGNFVTVELAQDLEALDDFQKNVPAVILSLHSTSYSGNIADNKVTQQVTKNVSCLLIGNATNIESLEETLVSDVIGYQPDQYHDQMTAVSGENIDIKGDFYYRRIIFQVTTHARS